MMLVSKLKREPFPSGGSMVKSRYVTFGYQGDSVEELRAGNECRSRTLSVFVSQALSFMYII